MIASRCPKCSTVGCTCYLDSPFNQYINEERISSFAFNIGREVEKAVKQFTDDIEGKNRDMESKIHRWYLKTKDESFAEYFNIKISREGKI